MAVIEISYYKRYGALFEEWAYHADQSSPNANISNNGNWSLYTALPRTTGTKTIYICKRPNVETLHYQACEIWRNTMYTSMSVTKLFQSASKALTTPKECYVRMPIPNSDHLIMFWKYLNSIAICINKY